MELGAPASTTPLRDVETTPANDLGEIFDIIDQSDLNQGICSPRVQKIIYQVHKSSTLVDHRTVHAGDPTTGLAKEQLAFALSLSRDNSNWRLFAQETGEAGEVVQTIYFAKPNDDGEWEAIPAFTMLEKANETHCSVSLTLPATIEDLEWGIVSTSADEGRPVTAEESLKDTPQTNAKTLDELLQIVQGKITIQQSGLLQTLHMEELLRRAFPKPEADTSAQTFAVASHETKRTFLAKHLRAIGEWSLLGAQPVVKERDAQTGTGQVLRFTSIDADLTQVDRVIKNLGTKEKTMPLGYVRVTPVEDVLEPLFISDASIAKYVGQELEEQILTSAEQAYAVPELTTDPELTASISTLIAEILATKRPDEHADAFNSQLNNLLRARTKKIDHHNRNSVLSLGTIDLSRLGPGTYVSVSDGYKLSAHIVANKQQSVFERDGYYVGQLIDCSVRGAHVAFKNITGKRLVAQDCYSAFSGCTVSDSVAEDTVYVFTKSGSATGCIAQNCYQAFDQIKVQEAIAVHCQKAFTQIEKSSENLFAILCSGKRKQLFTHLVQKLTRIDHNSYTANVRFSSKERKKQNFVEIDSTHASPLASYRAGKRFGPIPNHEK